MKRDMDLIRRILLKAEEAPPNGRWIELEFEGYDPKVIYEHVRLLEEAGLVDAQDLTEMDTEGPVFELKRLSWRGHEFLANARNESLWARAKATVTSAGGSVSLQVLQELLTDLAKNAVGLKT